MVTDSVVHNLILDDENSQRGDHYYCPVCGFEIITDFGGSQYNPNLVEHLRQYGKNVIDLGVK